MSSPIIKIVLHNLFVLFEQSYHLHSTQSDDGLMNTAAAQANHLYKKFVGDSALFAERDRAHSGKERGFVSELKDKLRSVDYIPNAINDYKKNLLREITTLKKDMPTKEGSHSTLHLSEMLKKLEKGISRVFDVWQLIPTELQGQTEAELETDAFFVFVFELTYYFAKHQLDDMFCTELSEAKFKAFCDQLKLLIRTLKSDSTPEDKVQLTLTITNALITMNTQITSDYRYQTITITNGTFARALEETRTKLTTLEGQLPHRKGVITSRR